MKQSEIRKEKKKSLMWQLGNSHMGASHLSMDHASKTLCMEEATVCHNIPNDSELHQFPNPWLEFLLHLSTKVARRVKQIFL
jgi:hypothetical protein